MIVGGAIAIVGAGMTAYHATRYIDPAECPDGDGERCDSKNQKVLTAQMPGILLMGSGLVMAIVGLVWQNEYLVKEPTTSTRDARKRPMLLYLAPQGPRQVGVGVSGSF